MVVVVVAVLVAGLAGVGVAGAAWWLLRDGGQVPAAAEGGRFDVAGDLVLPEGGYAWGATESSCTGGRGFDDIAPGTQVAVLDGSGKTLALGSLSTSTPTKGADGRLAGCTFSFGVRDVPAGEQFYQVQVGRRGSLRYDATQIRSRLRLTLS